MNGIAVLSNSKHVSLGCGMPGIFSLPFSFSCQETLKEKSENVALDVYLMNGNKLTVNIVSTDQRDDVLEVKLMFL